MKIDSLFFIALFISLTIPRCGLYWNRVPLTLANLLLGIVLLVWGIRLPRTFRLRSNMSADKKLRGLKKTAIIFLSYAFIWMVVGLFKGEVFGAVVNFMVIAGGILFSFLTVEILREEKKRQVFLNLVCLSLFITCLYGLLQVFVDIRAISIPGLTELYGSPKDPVITLVHGNPQVTAGQAWQKNNMWDWKSRPPVFLGTKIFSTFHHGNIFGSHLAAFLPLAIVMTMVSKNRTRAFLLTFLSILCGINLFFTNSRGALLGLLAGLVIMVALKRKSLLIIISLGLITILLFLSILAWAIFHEHNLTGVAPSVCLSNYEDRYVDLGKLLFFSPRSSEQWEVIDDISNQRLSTLKMALETVFHPPTLWKGLFGRSFKLEPDAVLHNFYITVIYKMGLVGFGLWGGLLIVLFRTILKSIPHLKVIPSQIIVIGGLAGLIAGLVHNLIDTPFYYPPLAINFWILGGAVMAMGGRERS